MLDPKDLKQVEIPSIFKHIPDQKNAAAYEWKEVSILYAEEKTDRWDWLKHVSISCRDRLPTWEEVLACKEHFFGDIDAMMVMPKKKDYVNIWPFCFHIWQTPQEWGIR